jgi:hypothetical protein
VSDFPTMPGSGNRKGASATSVPLYFASARECWRRSSGYGSTLPGYYSARGPTPALAELRKVQGECAPRHPGHAPESTPFFGVNPPPTPLSESYASPPVSISPRRQFLLRVSLLLAAAVVAVLVLLLARM